MHRRYLFVGVSVTVKPGIRKYTQTSAEQYDSSSPGWVCATYKQKVAKDIVFPSSQSEARSQDGEGWGGGGGTEPRICGLNLFSLPSLVKAVKAHMSSQQCRT